MFQHTAARRRLEPSYLAFIASVCFNTQPPEGGWNMLLLGFAQTFCFNTQPPEGGWQHSAVSAHIFGVSTHSRPKAAGCPPISSNPALFQHTAARRRLVDRRRLGGNEPCVSTHSRPKAAGNNRPEVTEEWLVSTHSRPKAAGLGIQLPLIPLVCFNTQPPEGGWLQLFRF